MLNDGPFYFAFFIHTNGKRYTSRCKLDKKSRCRPTHFSRVFRRLFDALPPPALTGFFS